ncbi:unnamed protein product [Parnassius mnemosyne]|uniref:Uncharacterized protein n=1 Tax=Parnassius mnemosyne TaxID=213953 RepID=A0AAV1KC18_9NEOP
MKAQDLSTDQCYLYSITSAVSTGVLPEDLANKSPGKMSHARWLTRANRILRLYIPTKSAPKELVILATYVVKVYAPTWFSIKTHPSCKDGARHLYKLISASRYLTAELKAVIDPVIIRNGYFAHPENLLLAMLIDSQQHIRELAARRILKARELPLLRLPCHTQAVERSVKTVTQAANTLCSKTAREGFIRAQIESCKNMPKFESKQDFRVN